MFGPCRVALQLSTHAIPLLRAAVDLHGQILALHQVHLTQGVYGSMLTKQKRLLAIP